MAELNSCSSSLTNLLPIVSNLLTSSSDMPGKVKDELIRSPLRIPSALAQVTKSVKALKESEENVKTMLKTTIPAIKTQLKDKTGADTTQKAAPDNPSAPAPLPSNTASVEMKQL